MPEELTPAPGPLYVNTAGGQRQLTPATTPQMVEGTLLHNELALLEES